MILLYLTFILWSCSQGLRDVFQFSERYKKKNIHWLLFTDRALVGFMIVLSAITKWEIFSEILIFATAIAFVFPFFQLTTYYCVYELLGHPNFNFFTSKSPTSNARISFTFPERLTGLIISLCLITYLYIS